MNEELNTNEILNTVETEPTKKKKIVKRIVEIVTNTHDKDGNEILTRAQIEKIIQKHKTIKFFAYALHDKDTVIEEDIVKYKYSEEDVGNDLRVGRENFVRSRRRPPRLFDA